MNNNHVLLIIFSVILLGVLFNKEIVETFRRHRRHRRGRRRHFRRRRHRYRPFFYDYRPWMFFSGSCKNGCSYLGNGKWGCQYPGTGANDCWFASDCDWCGHTPFWFF